MVNLSETVHRGWTALAAGNFDALVADYSEDMKLIMPGQTDVLLGAKAFRAALDNLSALLPPGFAIENLTHLEGDNEVVSIVEWSSSRVAASQFAVRFRFSEGKIFEERWFVDTKQWAAAF